jgi:hypothetical protein
MGKISVNWTAMIEIDDCEDLWKEELARGYSLIQ